MGLGGVGIGLSRLMWISVGLGWTWVRAGWRWDVLVRSEDEVGWELDGLCWGWPGMGWSEVEVG